MWTPLQPHRAMPPAPFPSWPTAQGGGDGVGAMRLWRRLAAGGEVLAAVKLGVAAHDGTHGAV